MTTITGVLVDPLGQPQKSRKIAAFLYTGNVRISGVVPSMGNAIVGAVEVVTDDAGAFSIDLVGNSLISPAGTQWMLVFELGAFETRQTISVPATGGPYVWSTLLQPPVGSLPVVVTYAPHTHSAADVTDFLEAVQDAVAALLVPGAGVTLTYNDTAGTLTVASTGGGSFSGSATSINGVAIDTAAKDTAGHKLEILVHDVVANTWYYRQQDDRDDLVTNAVQQDDLVALRGTDHDVYGLRTLDEIGTYFGLTPVSAPGPVIGTPTGSSVANMTVGTSVIVGLPVVGGIGPYNWTVVSGALPGGLNLTAQTEGDGVFFGTPATPTGTFNYTLRVTDQQGKFDDIVLSTVLAASGAALAYNLPNPIPQPAIVGQNYSFSTNIYASGGTKFAGSETAGHQTTPHYHYTSAGLPTQKIRLDVDGTVTGEAGRLYSRTLTWGGVNDPPNAVGTISGPTIICADAVPNTVTKALVLSINASGGGGGHDIAAYINTTADIVNNLRQVNALIDLARIDGTRIYSSVSGTCTVGYATKPMGQLLVSGNFGAGQRGLSNWDCANVTFKLGDLQPLNDSAQGAGSIIYIQYAATPNLKFTIDGNGANQSQSGANNPNGLYYDGLNLVRCGPTVFTVTVNNCRGVTGLKQTLNGTTVWETFDVNQRRSDGGDTGTIICGTPDGSTGKACSGAVWQYTENGATSPQSVVVVQSTGRRHGMGCYCAGDLRWKEGSFATSCGTGINIEAGDPSGGAGVGPVTTQDITIGNPADVTTYAQVTTSGCGTGLNMHGNSGASGVGVKSVKTYGYSSSNDGTAMLLSPVTPSPTLYEMHHMQILNPTGTAIKFNSKQTVSPGQISDMQNALWFMDSCQFQNGHAVALGPKDNNGTNIALLHGTLATIP